MAENIIDALDARHGWRLRDPGNLSLPLKDPIPMTTATNHLQWQLEASKEALQAAIADKDHQRVMRLADEVSELQRQVSLLAE